MFFKKRFLISNTQNFTGTALRINQIIKYTTGKKYLEIGVNYGFTFEGVNAELKVAVDPEKKFISFKSGKFFKGKSDDFFNINYDNYDMIFIDGLHEYEQVLRDIVNSLNITNEKGKVLIDDVFPKNFNTAIKEWGLLSTEEKLAVSKGTISWQGDVYKAIFLLINEYKEYLTFSTIKDDDHIQTVVWRKNHKIKIKYPSDKTIKFYNNPNWTKSLENGIPIEWNPCTMEDLLVFLDEST